MEANRPDEATMVFTEEAAGYKGLMNHVATPHGRGQYVHGEVHTNGIESDWSMLKRGIVGTYHHISPKHTERYAVEFAGRHNNRPKNTVDQITDMVRGMDGKRLRYADLIAGRGRRLALRGVPLTGLHAIPWRRQRLRLNEVDVRLRRNLECELRLTVRMGDGEVALADDVHADQHIPAASSSPAYRNVLHGDLVRQPDVDHIEIGFIGFVVDSRVGHFDLAYWL